MTVADMVLFLSGFLIVLGLGGLWADSRERRDARRRNRR